jgi:hypothetical protein
MLSWLVRSFWGIADCRSPHFLCSHDFSWDMADLNYHEYVSNIEEVSVNKCYFSCVLQYHCVDIITSHVLLNMVHLHTSKKIWCTCFVACLRCHMLCFCQFRSFLSWDT